MKIQLTLAERKYLYGLMKLFAHRETEPQAKLFWAELASRLGPNQLIAHLRRKEVRLMLDILTKAVETINGPVREKADELGEQLRADIVEKVLAGAKSKLEQKLAENPNGDDEDGIKTTE